MSVAFWRAVGACAAACIAGGCTITKIPAYPAGRVSLTSSPGVEEGAWPARDTGALPRINVEHSSTMAMTRGGSGASAMREVEIKFVVRGEPRGQGWIYESGFELAGYSRVESAGGGVVLFEYGAWRPGEAQPKFPPYAEGEPFNLTADVNRVLEAADYRQSFTLFLPEGEPVGLVLHAFSLGTGKNELQVTDALRRRGWAVLRTRLMDFYTGERPKRERGRTPPVAQRGAIDWVAVFHQVDDLLDQWLADYAYAAEAAVAYSQDRAPGLKGKPVVVMGFSLGAIMTPTTAARLGDQVAAAVMVGGGADIMSIITESPAAWNLGPVASLGRKLGSETFRKLKAQRLEETELDPYATAPLLRNRPVLVVHASWDSFVPSRYGELLWERLGRPERWIFAGGHIPLFWNVGRYSESIAEWVDRAVWERRGPENDRPDATGE